MYLKDYERKVLLEDGGIIDEEKELDPKKPLNYFEEQDLLKKSFKIKDVFFFFFFFFFFLFIFDIICEI